MAKPNNANSKKTTPSTPTKAVKMPTWKGGRIASPGGSKKYQNIDLFVTQAPNVVIAVASKPKDSPEASFTFPMARALDDRKVGDTYSSEWGVLMAANQRGDALGTVPKMSGQWEWKCFVMVKGKGETLENMGNRLAKAFTRFTKKPIAKMERPEYYQFRTAFTDDPKPLNFHLMDFACAKALRALYDELTKEEMMEDEGLMEAYFGTVEKGRSFLEAIEEDDWDDLLKE
jgi:hypothetical protein